MNAETGDAPSLKPISLTASRALEQRVHDARRLFQRTLALWASDLLILRSRGLRAIRWAGASHREAA